MEYEDPFAPVRKDIQFTQIENIRYENMEEFKEKISGLELLCEQAGTFEEIKELYAWLYQEYMKIDTAANVSQVEYHLNMLNEELAEKSLHNQAARSEAYILYEEAIRTVLASPYAQEFSDFIGEDVARQFGGDASRDAEKLAALMIREGELIKEYETISMQDNFTVEYDGKTWNLDTLIREQDKMTEEQYSAISDAIIIQKAEKKVKEITEKKVKEKERELTENLTVDMARKMLKRGVSCELASECTGLCIEMVKKLQEELMQPIE